MVKPPVVQLAGDAAGARPLHRHRRPGSGSAKRPDSELFWPPNVSGWDDSRWLDTSRMRARWNIVDLRARRRSRSTPGTTAYSPTETAGRSAGAGASPPGARPDCAANTATSCSTSPRRSEKLVIANWQKGPYRAMRQNALLQLIGVSPDVILQ